MNDKYCWKHQAFYDQLYGCYICSLDKQLRQKIEQRIRLKYGAGV